MDRRCIVPVDPASASGDVVVIEVQQHGSHPLDLRLIGCEGESAYTTTIEHRHVGKLKHKFKGTEDEWQSVLSHFLLQTPPESDHAGLLDHTRMVYALKNDKIEVTIRQDVKGIKLTLGEIVLSKDEETELNPFEWAQASAQAHVRTLKELADVKARVSSEQEAIAKLKLQLDDFVNTKNETEAAMLQQFMALLNEKKRKIRDQSRLLAGAKVDKTTASVVKATREEVKPRKAGASRPTKRKAPAKVVEPEREPEQTSDADQMEMDEAKAEEQEDESGLEAATPDRSDAETEDEDAPAQNDPTLSARQTRGKSSERARSQSKAAQSSEDVAAEDEEPPPARRELPFGRPATRTRNTEKKLPPTTDDGDETEDEEL